MTLHGEVVRRELSGAVLGGMASRGVGVRIVEAPPEYHAAFAELFADSPTDSDAAPEPDAGVAADEIEIELTFEPAAAEVSSDCPPRGPQLDERGDPTGRDDRPQLRVPGKPPREPAIENELEQVRKVEPVEELEPRDQPAPLVMPPDPDDPRRNDVLCVYDGDALQDLYAQLEDLGARPHPVAPRANPRRVV